MKKEKIKIINIILSIIALILLVLTWFVPETSEYRMCIYIVIVMNIIVDILTK